MLGLSFSYHHMAPKYPKYLSGIQETYFEEGFILAFFKMIHPFPDFNYILKILTDL